MFQIESFLIVIQAICASPVHVRDQLESFWAHVGDKVGTGRLIVYMLLLT